MVVLDCTRMYADRFADCHVTKADPSIVSHHWHTTSDSNQETEADVGEGHSHLGNHRGCSVIPRLPQPRNHNVLASNTAEIVQVVITGLLRETFMLVVQHLQRRN